VKSKEVTRLKQIITLAVLFTFLIYSKVNAADGSNFKIDDNWASGFQGQLIVKNETNKTYKNWIVEFDFPHEITSSWGAVQILNKDYSYVFEPPVWNSELKPGEHINIGFIAIFDGVKIIEPSNVKLIGVEQDKNRYVNKNDSVYFVDTVDDPTNPLDSELSSLKT
jgi:hypothetical protein